MRGNRCSLLSVAIVVLTLALGGCATLNEDECVTADWRTIGFEDGREGRLTSYVGAHREACAEHGVTPNLDAYLTGHAQGITEHCQPENGFQLGLHGRAYRGECPAGLEAAFVARHADGYVLYERRVEIDELRREIDRRLEEEDRFRQTIFEKRAALADYETSRRQRRAIRAEIEELVVERRRNLRIVSRLEDTLERALLDFYESHQEYLGGR